MSSLYLLTQGSFKYNFLVVIIFFLFLGALFGYFDEEGSRLHVKLSSDDRPKWLLAIMSSASRSARRNIIRQTYQKMYPSQDYTFRFILGNWSSVWDPILKAENDTHGDIWCMENFMNEGDSSANAIKPMLFYQWLAGAKIWERESNERERPANVEKGHITKYGGGPPMGSYKWVSKVDDDSWLNLPLFYDEYMKARLSDEEASTPSPPRVAKQRWDLNTVSSISNDLQWRDVNSSQHTTQRAEEGMKKKVGNAYANQSPSALQTTNTTLTLIGRPMSWERPYNYTSGRFYTMSWPLLTTYARLFAANPIANQSEDILTGRLLYENHIPHNLVPIADARAFDAGWEGLVGNDSLVVHALKSDERFLECASLFDEKGFRVNGAGEKGVNGLTTYNGTIKETDKHHPGKGKDETDPAYVMDEERKKAAIGRESDRRRKGNSRRLARAF